MSVACSKGNKDAIRAILTTGADPNIADADGDTCLCKAVFQECSKEVLQTIVDHGANVNATNSKYETALLVACSKGNEDAIDVLSTAGADPNSVDHDGDTCLHKAVFWNCSKGILQALIDQGANVNATNSKHETALSVACSTGNKDAICVILTAGADLDIADVHGDTCLCKAVFQECSKEVLQAMVDHGANINATNGKHETALSVACLKGNEDAIDVILAAGADPNMADADGDSCLSKAVFQECSKEVLQAIVDHGANVNATNSKYETALLVACSKGNEDAIDVLSTAGADPNSVDHDGDTCLHKAVFWTCSKGVLQALVDQGANVHATNGKNETALLVACLKGNEDAISVMLTVGADPNIVDADGDTCLHNAVFQDCSKEALQALVDQGANVNARNGYDQTALSVAFAKRNEKAISVILTAGADPNIVDADGDTCLHRAVYQGFSKEVLHSLVVHGANVNATNNKHKTALSVALACSRKNENAIHVILTGGADPAIIDANGDTCLHKAAFQNCSREILQALVDQGANVNATNSKRETALSVACLKGHEDAISIILTAGADPNIADAEGDACLYKAVFQGCSKEILQALVDQCTNVNATNSKHETALSVAFSNRNEDAISALVSAGADPNIVDDDGDTGLHKAVFPGFSEKVLQALVSHNANVNATSQENQTAVLLACAYGQDSKTRVLLDAGADPNIANTHGNTCLHYAADDDCPKDVLQAIIAHGADVNAQNQMNQTALLLACEKGDTDIITILLNAGADPNIADMHGNTCLHHAVNRYCSKDLLQALINQNADVNATNQTNQTALLLACEQGNRDVMNTLLGAGADFSIADMDGNTCFEHIAFNDCHHEMLQAIIDQGADVNVTNQHNQTLLVLACEQGNIEIIKILLNAGADPNITDTEGNTCLHHAADDFCPKEILQAIIDQGADVNVTNQRNQTALLKACANAANVKISILLVAGSDPTIADEHNNTCLHFSVLGKCRKDVIQAIVDHGADVNATNNKNHTAVMLACRQRNVHALDIFLNANKPRRWNRILFWKKEKNTKADPNIVDTDGNNCLHHAII